MALQPEKEDAFLLKCDIIVFHAPKMEIECIFVVPQTQTNSTKQNIVTTFFNSFKNKKNKQFFAAIAWLAFYLKCSKHTMDIFMYELNAYHYTSKQLCVFFFLSLLYSTHLFAYFTSRPAGTKNEES